MKVLILNISPNKSKGITAIITQPFIKGLKKAGADVEVLYTRDYKLSPCKACLYCWIPNPGVCVQGKDDAYMIGEKIYNADLVVFATPVFGDGFPSDFSIIMNRQFFRAEPFIVIENDRCSHPMREGIKKDGKLLLLSTAAFYEKITFNPIIARTKAISRNIHRDFCGALIRPHSRCLKETNCDSEKEKSVLKASENAGYEIVTEGRVSKKSFSEFSQEMIDRDDYVNQVNSYFNVAIKAMRQTNSIDKYKILDSIEFGYADKEK